MGNQENIAAFPLEQRVLSAEAEELERLSNSADEKIRQTVAAYGHLSEDLMEKLARDSSPLVRCAVPVNEGVTEKVLQMLVDDPEWEARWAVANSNNATIEVLRKLVNDEVEPVRSSAQEHLAVLN